MAQKNVVALCSRLKTKKHSFVMLYVTIQELEAAINYWRSQSPSKGEELRLCPEATSLAKPYALMIIQGSQRVPIDVLDAAARAAIQGFQKIIRA